MYTLITAAELKTCLHESGTRLFDCRFSLQDPVAGLRAYQAGHIPGAVFADLNQDLSTPHIPGVTGRHPLPERKDWIDKVCSWGLRPDTLVVLYDDSGGAGAARMWWMLHLIGHDKAMVLDGGWQAWLASAGQVATDIPPPADVTADQYSARQSLAAFVTAAEIDSDKQLLLDARESARFRGEVEPIDPVAGHIPGALCSPYTANLHADGSFKSKQELQEKFRIVAETSKSVVCYCGSGVTACHNILALVHAGFAMPLLYAGSWSEWITGSTRPVATGN